MNDLLLDDVFIYWLERTERQAKRFADAALREAGVEITPEQWVILKRISEQANLNQREIAALTFKDPAAVTRALDQLQARGLVERQEVPNDRRAYQLHLTEAGQALVATITPVALEVRARGLRGLSQEEVGALRSILNKIYENYQ